MNTLSKLEDELGGSVDLAAPGRKILCRSLGKEVSGIKFNKVRDTVVILMNDMLIFAESKKKAKYKPMKVIPLRDLKCSNKMDINLAVNAITFLDINDEMTTISFESQQVKLMWLTQINELKEGLIHPVRPKITKTRTPKKKYKQKSTSPTRISHPQLSSTTTNTMNYSPNLTRKHELSLKSNIRSNGSLRNSKGKYLIRKTVEEEEAVTDTAAANSSRK